MQETLQADLAHREYIANLLERQMKTEREIREELRRAENRKEVLISRLAQLDVSLMMSSEEQITRAVYTVSDKCQTPEGREELTAVLAKLDPLGMTTVEALSWLRATYPFRSVLPTRANFSAAVQRALILRHGTAKATQLTRGAV